MSFDWHYRTSPETGLLVLDQIVPTDGQPPGVEDTRFVEAQVSDDAEAGRQLTFGSVRGRESCADIALKAPAALHASAIHTLLQVVDPLATPRAAYISDEVWGSLSTQTGPGSRLKDAAAWRAALAEADGESDDHRIGTGNLVPGPSPETGFDVLVTDQTHFPRSTGRVVGELLEIWCLNRLYKATADPNVLRISVELINHVHHPSDIQRTWRMHLSRSVAVGSPHWQAHVKAIDLAQHLLAQLWETSSSTPAPSILERATP